jgi:predicted Zn-dependent protease
MVADTRGLNKNIIGLHQARAEYFALIGDFDNAIQQLEIAKRQAPNLPLASRIDAREREVRKLQDAVKEMM